MSKNWYPIINEENCSKCGGCIDKCKHGVYDKEKTPTPLVVNEEGCVEGCHGCGNLCPNGAITYYGDETGWIPPEKIVANEIACDGKDENKASGRKLWQKILIPILILLVVVCIYAYKKIEQNKMDAQISTEEKVNNDATTESDAKKDTDIVAETEDNESLPLEISKVDLDAIKAFGLPFVIDFGSDSCIPCKEMAPVLELLHSEWQGRAIVHFVDVWKNTTAANDFPVTVIPTQVFYNGDGTTFVPSDALAKEMEFTIYNSKDTQEHLFTVHQGGVTEEQMRKIFAEMGVK